MRLEFTHMNTTLSNTIEALANAPIKGYTKEDLNIKVEKVVNKNTTMRKVEMCKEMIIMQGEIIQEAMVCADMV